MSVPGTVLLPLREANRRRSLADPEVYKNKFLEDWADMTKIRKPIIAAVSGYAVRPPPAYILFPPLRALTGTPRSSAAGASSR